MAATIAPTRRLYQENAHAFSLESACVLSLTAGPKETVVCLDSTIAFPEGGGQPSDHASFVLPSGALLQMKDVRMNKDTNVVEHVLATAEPPSELSEGASVGVVVDERRRRDHMQQHSAQHLISALAVKHYGYTTASWALNSSGGCFVDFDTPTLSDEELAELEDACNAAIRAATVVESRQYSPEEYDQLPEDVKGRNVPDSIDKIRIVSIGGLDNNMCCGTHVSNLAELQAIKFVGVANNSGKARLTYMAGERVLSALGFSFEHSRMLNDLLGCGPDGHEGKIEKMLAGNKANNKTIKALSAALAESEVAHFVNAEDGLVTAHYTAGDGGFLRSVATKLAAQAPDKCGLFTCGPERGEGMFVIVGPCVEAVGDAVAAALDGKGKGKGNVYQGKAGRVEGKDEAAAVIAEFLGGSEA